MDIDNPVVKLCIEGTQAEYEKRDADARALYEQAWRAARDDYEACIAAHYMARHQERPEDALYWNQEALDRANAIADERVQEFYPSLFLNMGHSYEMLGNQVEAQRYYRLAARFGVTHSAE
jgi:tetratricopeptide (TPR) repeat protein